MTLNWLDRVENLKEDVSEPLDRLDADTEQEKPAFQLEEYEHFVRASGAYQWLLSRIRQHERLELPVLNTMAEIGTSIEALFQTQTPLMSLSRQRARPFVTMVFDLDWNPLASLSANGLDPAMPGVMESYLCLTGTVEDCQATSVAEYMAQTWPRTWRPLIGLLEEVCRRPEGDSCTCTQRTCMLERQTEG